MKKLFANREQAGRQLAERLKVIPLTDPVVLAIPRGGVEVAAPIARSLGAELDVVLSRKIRAPDQPELALGAVSETGEIYLTRRASPLTENGNAYIEGERRHQMAEIQRRKATFRSARPRVAVAGRSVIVTDDGIATGSTMIAALRTIREDRPREIIVAVPVASKERLNDIRSLCDRVECLVVPSEFWSVGQFFEDFEQVSDDRAVQLLGDSIRHERLTLRAGNAHQT